MPWMICLKREQALDGTFFLVDAINSRSVSREAALWNARVLWPKVSFQCLYTLHKYCMALLSMYSVKG